MQLTDAEKAVHENAVRAGANLLRSEWPVIVALRRMSRNNLYKKFAQPSLFKYATHYLGLSDSAAMTFNSVMRKCIEVPRLREAIRTQRLSVWKANRLVAGITNENAEELIAFACTHTDREIDLKVAKDAPGFLPKDRVKVLDGGYIQITTVMRVEEFEALKRAESLEAQRGQLGRLGQTISTCVETHLDKHDPVRKAERAKPRETLFKQSRKPQAAEIHKVNLRDRGRCTHVDESGQRCNSDRWVEHHHVQPYSQGGESSAENLTTLCSYHHKLAHNVIRCPEIRYRTNTTYRSTYHHRD